MKLDKWKFSICTPEKNRIRIDFGDESPLFTVKSSRMQKKDKTSLEGFWDDFQGVKTRETTQQTTIL